MKLTTDKPYTKAEAFAAVKALRKGDQVDLDRLLLYFAPARTVKPKNAMQWVALACGVNDVRQYLNYVYVANGEAFGCDGHRVHRAAVGLPDGYYCPRTFEPVAMSDTYPDIDRVLTNFKNGEASNLADWSDGITENVKPVTYKQFNGETAINAQYLKHAMPVDNIVYPVRGSGCYGVSEFGSFAIMEVRV